MSRIRKPLAWAALACCLLLRVGGPEGLVICVGFDGHLDVEAARDGVCYARAPATVAPLPAEPAYAEEPYAGHCCICFDIPLSVDGPIRYLQPAAKSPPLTELLHIPIVESPAAHLSGVEVARPFGQPPPSTGPPRDSIATVVLLC